MLYLILSILTASSLVIIFKLYGIWGIRSRDAIVVNYFVAGTLSLLANSSDGTTFLEGPTQPWFIYALIMGFLFITIFNVMAISANVIGVSVTSVANKMSLVIPVVYAIFFLNDSIGLVKVFGLILAVIGVYLTSKSDKKSTTKVKGAVMLPLIVFIGSGIIDTLFKFNEINTIGQYGLNAFLAWIFYTAFVLGVLQIIYAKVKNNENFQLKAIWGGLLLGVPNVASGYYLVKTLSVEGFESSVVFPVNNMAIVSISAIVGIWFFKEKMSRANFSGIIICLLAIGIIAFSANLE